MIPNPESLDQGLIVSVQAPQGSPMRDPDVIAAMADAALRNGAGACRLILPRHRRKWRDHSSGPRGKPEPLG